MRNFIGFLLLILNFLTYPPSCYAQNSYDIFSHEYYFLSISLYEEDNYPVKIDVMIEPDDTLALDFQNKASVINSIPIESLLVNDFRNVQIFYDLYGEKEIVANSYWLFISGFNSDLHNTSKKQTYNLHNGGKLVVEYMKIVGLFATYRIIDDADSVELFGERANLFTNICPLQILYCEQIEDLNIVSL